MRHVCGHDVHTAVGVAVAEALASQREKLSGTVVFIFQGAEETASGAQAMLEDGVFGDLDPVEVFAVHTGPLPAGTVGVIEGTTLVGRDQFSFSLKSDADRAAAEAALAALAEAEGSPSVPCGFERGSGSGRVLSGRYTFGGPAGLEACRRAAEAALAPFGARVSWPGVLSSGVWSTPQVARQAMKAIRASLGEGAAVESGPAPPDFSEDFGFFLEGRAGALFWLGVGPEGRPHTPGYVADEASILAGAKAMTTVLLDSLERQTAAPRQ